METMPDDLGFWGEWEERDGYWVIPQDISLEVLVNVMLAFSPRSFKFIIPSNWNNNTSKVAADQLFGRLSDYRDVGFSSFERNTDLYCDFVTDREKQQVNTTTAPSLAERLSRVERRLQKQEKAMRLMIKRLDSLSEKSLNQKKAPSYDDSETEEVDTYEKLDLPKDDDDV